MGNPSIGVVLFSAFLVSAWTHTSAQDPCAGAVCDPNPPGVGASPALYGSWDGPWQLGTHDSSGIGPDWVCEGADPCDDPALGIAHATLLVSGDRQGKVLLWDKRGLFTFWDPDSPCVMDAVLWYSLYPGPAGHPGGCAYDMFCGSSTVMDDGRVLMVGGADYAPFDYGRRETVLFDPTVTNGTADPWEWAGDMAQLRYYPTVMPMLEPYGGLPFVVGGTRKSITLIDSSIVAWETLSPLSGFTDCLQLATAWSWDLSDDPNNQTQLTYYPRAFQLSSDGEIFLAGDTPVRRTTLCTGVGNDPGETWFIDPPAPGGATGTLVSGPLDVDRYYGNAVLMHQLDANGGKDRVLVFGGSSGCFYNALDPSCCDGSVTEHRCVKELDYQPDGITPGGTSTWVDKAPMLCPRVFSNAIVLPTGDVFVGRGSSTDLHNDNVPFDALPHAEIYTPGATKLPGSGSSQYTSSISATFDTSCPGTTDSCDPGTFSEPPARTYHAVSLLLPDGSVFTAGGDNVPGNGGFPGQPCGQYGPSAHAAEVYKPAYMHLGWRPEITSHTAALRFNRPLSASWESPDNTLAEFDRLVLIRPGSVTHHFDPNQRYIELEVSVTSTTIGPQGQIIHGVVAAAPSKEIAPSGSYLLFVVADDGTARVPSEGVFVTLN